jgi:pimeloyl-ACP methyl ester carboxylesterase
MKDITKDFPPEGHLASVNGMDMYYEVHGEGSPLILLHGLTASSRVWRSQIGEFAKHHRTIPIDLRGHGWSTNPADEFTHRQAAQDVFALMDQLSIDRFKAIGHCSGAMILLHMATQQPERLESMVLIRSSMYTSEEDRAWARQLEVQDISEELREFHSRGDDSIRALMRQVRDSAEIYDDVNFTPPYLSTISARTLIVHGDRDRMYPIHIPIEVYGAIPNSYLWIVPNEGGMPRWGRFEAVFVETALEFLSGAWDE